MKKEKIIKMAVKAMCAYMALAAGLAVGSLVVRLLSNPFIIVGVAGAVVGLYIGRSDSGAKKAAKEGVSTDAKIRGYDCPFEEGGSGVAGANPEERRLL